VTAREFRGSYPWKRARRQALRCATVCELCGAPFRLDLGPRHRLAPSVDHIVPLSRLDLGTPEGRAWAVDPALLRVAHLGCNARRGARDSSPAGPVVSVSREW